MPRWLPPNVLSVHVTIVHGGLLDLRQAHLEVGDLLHELIDLPLEDGRHLCELPEDVACIGRRRRRNQTVKGRWPRRRRRRVVEELQLLLVLLPLLHLLLLFPLPLQLLLPPLLHS